MGGRRPRPVGCSISFRLPCYELGDSLLGMGAWTAPATVVEVVTQWDRHLVGLDVDAHRDHQGQAAVKWFQCSER